MGKERQGDNNKMKIPELEDKNDYTIRRKKRGAGSYKSGPYARLNLPPPKKPKEGFEFKLPDGKRDEVREVFPRSTTFWALKKQRWFCASCGVLCRYSDMSEWEGPIAEFIRNPKDPEKVIGLCPECFQNAHT